MKLGSGINETCERIKEEFNYIQNQYHKYVFFFGVQPI